MHGGAVDTIRIVVEHESVREHALHVSYPAHRGAAALLYRRWCEPDRDHALRRAAARRSRPLREGDRADGAWAFHERSYGWLVLSLAMLAGMVCVARVPSRARRARRRRLCAGGLLGNCLSAAWNGMEVPNPLVLGSGDADLSRSTWPTSGRSPGSSLLVLAIGLWLIRNRALIPAPAEVRATRGRAFRPPLRLIVPSAGQNARLRVDTIEYDGKDVR